jgi:HK97 gp10 family phage protein
MANFNFDFDPELVRQLERLDNFDEIAPKMLNDAIPILERSMKSEASKHALTSDLTNSIKKTKAKKNQHGWYVSARPTGKDRKGVSNMQKLVHSEYGTSQQSPTPIIAKTLNNAESEVMNVLQETFNEVIGE